MQFPGLLQYGFAQSSGQKESANGRQKFPLTPTEAKLQLLNCVCPRPSELDRSLICRF
jgi:hypothetical protein